MHYACVPLVPCDKKQDFQAEKNTNYIYIYIYSYIIWDDKGNIEWGEGGFLLRGFYSLHISNIDAASTYNEASSLALSIRLLHVIFNW